MKARAKAGQREGLGGGEAEGTFRYSVRIDIHFNGGNWRMGEGLECGLLDGVMSVVLILTFC